MQLRPILSSSLASLSIALASQAQHAPLFDAPQVPLAYPTDLVVADFDGDGTDDFLCTNHASATVAGSATVELGLGDGTFVEANAVVAGLRLASADFDHNGLADAVTFYSNVGRIILNPALAPALQSHVAVDFGTSEVLAADFNGDTWADVAFATTDGRVTISLNAGGGSFPNAIHQALVAATTCAAFAHGDVDGDGDVDLLVLDVNLGQVVVLLGNGAGNFAVGPALVVGAYASTFVVADLTGDGLDDLAVVSAGLDRVSVLRNSGAALFVPLASFNVGDQPADLVAADWNLDGELDLVTADELGRQVTVLLSPGTSTPAQLAQKLGNAPSRLATGDFDGDHRADLLAVDWVVSEHRGRGDGTFDAPREYAVDSAFGVACADLDGDGDLDLALARTSPGAITVLQGDGAGSFALGATQGVNQGPQTLALGDLDGDGAIDAVTSNPASTSLSVLLGNGNATFAAPAHFALTHKSSRPALGDLDGDGDLDVAVAFDEEVLVPGFGQNHVVWLAGNGNGGLGAPVTLAMGAPAESVAVGDLDGDGDVDLVTVGCDGIGTGYVAVRINQGGGSFAAALQFPAPRWVFDLELGDMDLDGDLDAVVVGDWQNNLSIFENLGAGAFAIPAHKFELGGSLRSPRVLDVDLDGDLDVACADLGDSLLVALNGGIDALTNAGDYGASGVVVTLAPGDFDGDGDIDLASASPYGTVGVVGNQAVVPPTTYCTPTPNSLACTPSLAFTGRPSVSSAQPFVIRAANLLNQKAGLLFYGFGASATPYLGGTFCVAPPVRRTSVQSSAGSAAGNDCSGSFAFDFNAHIQSGVDPALSAGERVFAQHWSRDPGANPHFGWTDAIEFRIAP